MTTTATGPVWRCRRLDTLSARELEAIFQVRQQVFVVEQACAYLDADGHDAGCLHLTAHDGADLLPIAYARLLPPGMKYVESSIGRVLTRASHRGSGLGCELVRRAVADAVATFPGHDLRISAQAHLAAFYASFGFMADKPPHIEDGIPHVEMLRRCALTPAGSRLPAS